jgi:O-antigen ligase
MKINKNNTVNNIACLSIFILISTLYSSLDILAYIAFFLLFSVILATGKFKSINRIEVIFSALILSTMFSLIGSIDLSLSLVPSIYFLFIIIFSLTLGKSAVCIVDFEKILFFSVLGFIVLNLRSLFGDFTNVRFSGVAGQPNALGLISGTGFVISVAYLYLFAQSRRLSKPMAVLAISTSLFLIISSGSRGAIISILVALLYLFLKNVRNNFKAIVSISVLLTTILVVFYDKIIELPLYSRLLAVPSALGLNLGGNNIEAEFANATDDTRIDIASTAFGAFLSSPIFGNGINTFSYFSEFVYTHNSYLEILFSQGLFGIILYGSFILYSLMDRSKNEKVFFKKLVRSKKFVIIYFIFAGFSIPNFQNKSQIVVYSFILISILVSLQKTRNTSESQ